MSTNLYGQPFAKIPIALTTLALAAPGALARTEASKAERLAALQASVKPGAALNPTALLGGIGQVTDLSCPAGFTVAGAGTWGPNADGVTTQNLRVAGGPTSTTKGREYFTHTGTTAQVVQAQLNCCRMPGG